MIGVAWAQLRHRPQRALVPFVAVGLAVGEIGAPDPALSALVGWLVAAVVAVEALLLAQRPDLAVLSRLGWPPARLYGLVAVELVIIAVPALALGVPLALEVR